MSVRRAAGRRALLATLLASLAACATPPASAPDANFWSGRLALRIATDPPQTMAAAFELSGDANTGALALLSPLGQTVALARWSPDGATLQQGDRTTPYTDMKELSEQLTGAALPVEALFQWLRGDAVQVAGWTVDLSALPEGLILAQRLLPLPRAELRMRLQP